MNFFPTLDLTILFFFLGAMASWLRSDLEIPETVSKFLSIFLLLSMGLKGGHEVATSTDLLGFSVIVFLGLLSCLLIPCYIFYLFKGRLGIANAAALAASYGSVSAINLIAAKEFLFFQGVSTSGYMVAVMALMEIPAIIVAHFLYQSNVGHRKMSRFAEMKSVLTGKSVILLLGGFLIGLVANESTWNGLAPVVQGSFKGVLAFFLLDLGISAQKRLREAWKYKLTALMIGCFLPIINGTLILLLAIYLDVNPGDRVLLAVLAGSASYIAAPAAIRSSIPEANPGLYVALPLALTFPMNVLLGLPFYSFVNKLF